MILKMYIALYIINNWIALSETYLSWFVFVCLSICMSVCVCVCVCMYVYTHTHTHTHTYIHTLVAEEVKASAQCTKGPIISINMNLNLVYVGFTL